MAENGGQGAERPGMATAIGVISIVYCSLSILGVLFSAVGLMIFRFSRALIEAATYEVYEEIGGMFGSIVGLMNASMALSVLRGAVGGVGLAGGIGLLAAKRWSRMLCTAYGAATVALGLFQFVFITEKMNEIVFYADDVAGLGLLRAMRGVGEAAGVAGLILGAIFPVVVVILVNLPHMRRFISGERTDEPGEPST